MKIKYNNLLKNDIMYFPMAIGLSLLVFSCHKPTSLGLEEQLAEQEFLSTVAAVQNCGQTSNLVAGALTGTFVPTLQFDAKDCITAVKVVVDTPSTVTDFTVQLGLADYNQPNILVGSITPTSKGGVGGFDCGQPANGIVHCEKVIPFNGPPICDYKSQNLELFMQTTVAATTLAENMEHIVQQQVCASSDPSNCEKRLLLNTLDVLSYCDLLGLFYLAPQGRCVPANLTEIGKPYVFPLWSEVSRQAPQAGLLYVQSKTSLTYSVKWDGIQSNPLCNGLVEYNYDTGRAAVFSTGCGMGYYGRAGMDRRAFEDAIKTGCIFQSQCQNFIQPLSTATWW